MDNGSLVTTIIPVFNRPALLAEAVESVLGQTYRPIEIIIVDDGSTDDTPTVAGALAAQHAPIIRAIQTENGGPGSAREAGRLAARGDYIQHLDSDDLLLPRKFELQVAALRARPECGVAYGRVRYRDGRGREIVCDWKPNNLVVDTLFPSLLLARWWETVIPLFRTSLTDAIGPWTDLRLEEDWEYDARVAATGTRLAFVDEVIAENRNHDESRLSRGAGDDPVRLRDRARAHELIASHASRARVDPTSPEFQHFARELFHLARQCGAAGLNEESQRLVAIARGLSSAIDIRAYELIGRTLGWQRAGRAAAWLDRLR